MNNTVGFLRQQSALCDAKTEIEIVAPDYNDERKLPKLKVIGCYPDTKSRTGQWGPCFKIAVEIDE